MSALRNLQQRFQNYVYRRQPGMEAQVVGTPSAGAQERLEVYADAYRLRLVEVLADDLPGLKAMAGAGKFDELGRAYIEAHPSLHFNVRWYPDGLAEFLRTAAPWSADPALAEMAALEWAMTLVFDAADEPVAGVGAVGRIAPEAWGAMIPVPIQALRRLTLRHNVAEIRKAVDRKTETPAARRLESPQDWIVWRKDLTVYYRPLEADEALLAGALERGAAFAEFCAALCARMEPRDAAPRAAALLKRWLEDGLIREICSGTLQA